jgi:hypothetical protein
VTYFKRVVAATVLCFLGTVFAGIVVRFAFAGGAGVKELLRDWPMLALLLVLFFVATPFAERFLKESASKSDGR